MAKKVQKVTAKVGDATLQRRGTISFPDKYKKWENQCKSLGPSRIGGKVSLLAWLKRHGQPSKKPSRTNSPNTGLSGMGPTIETIKAVINKRLNGIYYEKDVEDFEDILDDLAEYDSGGSLDPAMIPFTTYPTRDGKVIPDAEAITVYGHYIDEYFESKGWGSKGGPSASAAKGWLSRTAGEGNPPIKQAIFGGPLFGAGLSLKEIVETAIEEINKVGYILEIKTGRSPVALVNVPSFRSKLAGAVRSSLVDGDISVRQVQSKMNGVPFKIEGDKEKAFVAAYSKTQGVAGEFEAFEVNMSPANTKKVIETWMATSRGVKERDIVKSWVDIVKVRRAGKVISVDGKYYRMPPDAYEEYMAEINNLKNDPSMRGNQEAITRIARRRIIRKYNLQGRSTPLEA